MTVLPDVLSADTFEQLFHRRHSCRTFLNRPVPDETVARVLEMAKRTASWCNSQPWRVIVTAPAATDRLRKALFEHAKTSAASFDIEPPREYRGVYLPRRRDCGFRLYESLGIEPGDRAASARQAMENFRFFGAPHVAIVTTESALGPYGVLD